MVEIGERAPHFTLYDTDGKLWSLEEFKGDALIILFFPCAFSQYCTQEMNEMQNLLEDIVRLNAEVIGISTDSVFTLAEFKRKHKYKFPFLSDYNKDTARAYGVLYAEFHYGMKGVSQRAVFVLDGQDRVVHKEVMEDPAELPNFEKIQIALKKTKMVKDEG